MNSATLAFLAALHFDAQRRSLQFSSQTPGLEAAANPLRRAFGDGALVRLTDVKDITETRLAEGRQRITLTGKSRDAILGMPQRVRLTAVLHGAAVEGFVLTVSLPKGWSPSAACPALAADPDLGKMVLNAGEATVGSDGSGSQAPTPAWRITGTTAQAAVSAGRLDQALTPVRALLPGAPLPDAASLPERVEILADFDAGLLAVDLWWPVAPVAGLTGIGTVLQAGGFAAGVSLSFDLNASAASPGLVVPACRIDTGGGALVLEAWVAQDENGQPAACSYRLRPGTLVPFAQSIEDLAARYLGDAGGVVAQTALSILALTYVPGQSLTLSVMADLADGHPGRGVTLAPGLALDDVVFTLQHEAASEGQNGDTQPGQGALDLVLKGGLSLFGTRFAVRARRHTDDAGATYEIEGALEDPAGVDLGKMIQSALPVELPFGLDTLTLTRADLSLATGDKGRAYRLDLTLDGAVKIGPGGVFELDEITLGLIRDETGATGAEMAVRLTLGQMVLQAHAAYGAGGWSIDASAAAADEAGFSLADLADHLVGTFGVPMPPDEALDVALDALFLSYETASEQFQIEAQGHWTVPDDIPFLAGKGAVDATVTVARDGDSGKHAATVALTLNDTLADLNAARLDVAVTLSAEDKQISVDLDASERPLHLTDLLAHLPLGDSGAGDVLSEIADSDLVKDLASVARLAFLHDSAQGQTSLAWSCGLGASGLIAQIGWQSGKSGDDAGGHPQIDIGWQTPDGAHALQLSDVLKGAILTPVYDGLKTAELDDLLTLKAFQISYQGDEALTLAASTGGTLGAEVFVQLGAAGEGGERPVVVSCALNDAADPLDLLPDALASDVRLIKSALADIALTRVSYASRKTPQIAPPAFGATALLSALQDDGSAPASPAADARPLSLQQGLTLGTRITFGKDALIRKIVDIAEIDADLMLGTTVSLQVALADGMSLSAGPATLRLGAPTLTVSLNTETRALLFKIGASISARLFGKGMAFEGWFELSEEDVSAHLKLSELPVAMPITPCLMLPGVEVPINAEHPLYLDFGMPFEPPGFDLGLQCSFQVCTAGDPVSGDAIFVLEIVEEVPQPLCIEFGIEKLTIPVLLEAVTGLSLRMDLAKDLVGLASKRAASEIARTQHAIAGIEGLLSPVALNHVQFYWADGPVDLPDGSTMMPGVGVRGGLQVFDWQAYAAVELTSSGVPGLTGDFEANPIEIAGILKVTGDGKGMQHAPTSFADSVVSGSSDTGQRLKPDAADDGSWFLKPGGPILHLSTRAAPFFHADLHVVLLGLHADVHADITAEGFDFDLTVSDAPIFDIHLSCRCDVPNHRFDASGSVTLHLHGEVGPILPGVEATRIHLDTDLRAEATLHVDTETFKLQLHGEFEFQGTRFDLPEVTIDERFDKLTDLADKVFDAIRRDALHIFADVMDPVKHAVEAGAKEVEKAAVAVADKAEEIGKDMAKDAAQVLEQANRDLDEARKETEEAMKDAEAQVAAMALAANQAADAAQKAVEDLEKQGEALIDDATGWAGDQVALAKADVEALQKMAIAFASDAIKAADEVAGTIARDAQAAVADIERQTREVEQEIEDLAKEALSAVADAAGSVGRLLHVSSIF